MKPVEPPRPEAETPPPFGSWPVLYTIVIAFLALTIVLLHLLTKAFS